MSSISSAGGTSLYQWLQTQEANAQESTQTSAQSSTQSTTPAILGQTDASGDTDPTGEAAEGSGHKHHGHHHGESSGVSTQLQSAITSALSSSNGSSDPNQIIENTIKQFLQGQSGQSQTGGQSTGGTATSGSGTPASASDPASQQSAFAQVLQANGVDPQQFQSDLQTALQGATSNGGSVDFAQLFQNFPPGSAVNVLA